MSLCSETEILQALRSLPQWTRRGQTIQRTYEFEDFPGAMRFVNRIAATAEAAGHHPDIDIRWNRVRLELTTHDSGGLTALDFKLAHAADRLC